MRRLILVLSLVVCSLDAVAAVTGHVVDDDGKPLAGVRVRAIALEPLEAQYARLGSASPEPVPLSEAQTNDAGVFRVDTKRQAVVTLLIDAPARTAVVEDAVDGEDAGTFLLRTAPVKKGRVTANGKPVANALVIVNGAFLTRTSDAGEYSIPDPATWVNRITVLHPSFAMAEQTRPPRDQRDSWGSLDVALDAGVTARGRVVDPAGRPIANATLRNGLWPAGTSGEDGSFTIAHLPSNVKTLFAREANRVGTGSIGAETVVIRPAATVGGTVRSTKDDTPVAGAKVSLRGDALPGFVPTAITDAKGNFVFDGIPTGIVQLGVSHPAFSSASVGGVAAPEGGRVDRALTATPLARVSGVVVDEEKKPVGGARIAVFGGPWNYFSAPDGSFSTRFLSFERGALLEVSKASYAGATHGPLRLEPGDVRTGIRIILTRGTKFEFRLVDPQGVAIADEPVMIRRRVDPVDRFMAVPVRCGASADPQSCRSDAEGKLTVNVAEATYDVHAGGLTTVERLLAAQTLAAADSPMTIELERGASIEGRVVWSDGTSVTIPATVSDSNRNTGVQVVDGAFAMKNVRAGKTVLTVQTGPPSFMTGEPVEVTAPATGVVLKLARPGRIEGRVVERDTRRAVPQFSVDAESRAGIRRGRNTKSFTALDGKFTLDDVPPGSVDVVVTAPGFVRSTTSAVEIEEGRATTVEVTLERAGTVAGRVTSGGRAVAGASISTGDARGRGGRESKQTDANGEYVLDTLSAGSHELTVRKQGYVPGTVTVNVAAGKETRGDVELSRGREVQGRVVDTAGRPIAAAEVLVDEGVGRMNFDSRIVSDADGNFRLEGLGDETVTVIARKSGYADGSAEVTPGAGSVTVTLDRGGTITGRVIGLPPAELQGVEINAMPTTGRRSGRPIAAFADASGAFTVTGVPDGSVMVSAQEVRPPRRRVGARSIEVTGGVAPFVELDFGAGFTVRGRVTRRGQPVSAGTVIFAPANPRERGLHAVGEIGGAGAYELRVSEAGEYEVMVSLRDSAIGTTRMGKLDVRGEMQHDIDVRGSAVRVRVIDGASGVPLPDTRVMLVGERSGGTDRTTDSFGRIVFDFVADGAYTLRAVKQGYAAEPREIRVQGGADVDVDLAVSRAEAVTLRLIDAATKRVAPDTFAAILDSAGRTIADRPAQTDPTGGLRYWLQPGNYTVRVMSRQYEPKTVPLVVPGTPLLEIELARSLRGRTVAGDRRQFWSGGRRSRGDADLRER